MGKNFINYNRRYPKRNVSDLLSLSLSFFLSLIHMVKFYGFGFLKREETLKIVKSVQKQTKRNFLLSIEGNKIEAH